MSIREQSSECQTCLSNSKTIESLRNLLEDLDDIRSRTQVLLANLQPCRPNTLPGTIHEDEPQSFRVSTRTASDIEDGESTLGSKSSRLRCPHRDCFDKERTFAKRNNLLRHFTTRILLDDEECLFCGLSIGDVRKYIKHFEDCGIKKLHEEHEATSVTSIKAFKRREDLLTMSNNLLDQQLRLREVGEVNEGIKRRRVMNTKSARSRKVRILDQEGETSTVMVQSPNLVHATADNGSFMAERQATSGRPSLPCSKDNKDDVSERTSTTDRPRSPTGKVANVQFDGVASHRTNFSAPMEKSFDGTIPERALFSTGYTIDDPFDGTIPERALFSTGYTIDDPFDSTIPERALFSTGYTIDDPSNDPVPRCMPSASPYITEKFFHTSVPPQIPLTLSSRADPRNQSSHSTFISPFIAGGTFGEASQFSSMVATAGHEHWENQSTAERSR